MFRVSEFDRIGYSALLEIGVTYAFLIWKCVLIRSSRESVDAADEVVF